jgi:transporter family protein
MATSAGWFYCAILSTMFATIGIQNVNADLATLIPTAIIMIRLSAFVACIGKWANSVWTGEQASCYAVE